MNKCVNALALSVVCVISSCRGPEIIPVGDEENKGEAVTNAIAGFYLLNEGNMGSNKATLDYYDYTTATYHRNIYAQANPNVPMELGDVGNDLQLYGSRLYAVINCSNKVEVMDARACKRIGQLDIPNCRYICFSGPYGYVTSYAGPVEIKQDYEQIGYVARFDTATLQVLDRCLVGFQPDEVVVANGKLYVANSGGYMVPNYEHTVSVIDLATFTEEQRINVAVNLHRIRVDRYGMLWVTSRGDYYDEQPGLYCINPATNTIEKTFPLAVSDLDIVGDSLYFCSTAWSYLHMDDAVSYGVINIRTRQVVSSNFIKDGTDQQIRKPYGVKINPATREIFVTDAKDYVTPGTLYCFSPQGNLKWSVRTGDIPAHMAFCPVGFYVMPTEPVTPRSDHSPYISRVWEYCPAPGQFINELPEYEDGDDANTMRLKAEEAIADNNRGMISLGGWGGYVTFSFDHMVPNIPGEYDLLVLGNAFYSEGKNSPRLCRSYEALPNKELLSTRSRAIARYGSTVYQLSTIQDRPGGSCEPGIVMVSYDDNGNGRPDDPWYELAGSEYHNPQTVHDYSLTYYRSDTTHRNPYHTQPYFPQWIQADSLTFTGTRLPDNYEDTSGNGTYYILYAYPYGYADNHPNSTEQARLKIDWAVRPDGTPVHLPGIHFVRVYTGLHQYCGWLGETSTEILGAEDLHMTIK